MAIFNSEAAAAAAAEENEQVLMELCCKDKICNTIIPIRNCFSVKSEKRSNGGGGGGSIKLKGAQRLINLEICPVSYTHLTLPTTPYV